jgi:WD40 repeat protein
LELSISSLQKIHELQYFHNFLSLFYRKTFVNVAIQLADAHEKGSDASCITFAYDNHHIATRGGDDTLKLWDIRYFKKPVKVASNLFSR